jgi:hypothetical protein
MEKALTLEELSGQSQKLKNAPGKVGNMVRIYTRKQIL